METIWSVFQDHVKYIQNEILKSFRVVILQYAERVREMHEPANYLPPPLMKGIGFEEASLYVRDKELRKDVIRVATKDGIPTSMQYEL